MTDLTMTDCSVEANRVQARYELDRADTNSSVVDKMCALANWSDKWARPLLDYADDAPTKEDVTVAANTVDNERGAEIEKLRSEIAERIGEMRGTLNELEQL